MAIESHPSRTFDRWLVGASGVVACLVASVVLTCQSTWQLNEDATWVTHTLEVMDALHEVRSHIRQAREAQRGYLVRGGDRPATFDTNIAAARQAMQVVKELTRDNPEQQARVPTVETAIEEIERALRGGMDAGGAPAGDLPLRLLATGEKPLTDFYRLTDEMVQAERQLLRARSSAHEEAYRLAIATELLSGVVAILAVLAFMILLWRHLRTRLAAANLIAEQRRELRESDRRKDEFLATLAHELRNPLVPIRNALSIMDVAEDDRQAFYQTRQMMERQLNQIVRLIDDLMDVSRISRGKVDLRVEHAELAPIIDQAVESCRPLADANHQQLSVFVPSETAALKADPARLTQVFSNLLQNACKFTPPGGKIELTAKRHDGNLVVTVKDNGIGIAADKLETIFEMFAQAEPAADRGQSGLGIGLTLTRRLVELHGGTIEACSAGPGKGSEFIIRLPLVAALHSNE